MGLSNAWRSRASVRNAARTFGFLAIISCVVLGAVAVRSQTTVPATLPMTKIGVAALISPTAAANYYGASTTSTDALASIMGYSGGTPIAPEIWDLAHALKNNPDLIYEYVHNNIAVNWMYGMQKGALGALIDKSGTPFDQVALMIALLNQAGYSASYVSGTITLTGAQFTAWTGIADSNAACQMLANGGIPAIVNGSTNMACLTTSGSSISSVTMSHIWVSATISGTAYLFDPAYKTFTWKTGIPLATAAQFTSGQPLSAATSGMTSGTISGTSVPYVNGLNGTNLTNTITGYAQNLLAYIETPSNTVPSPSAPLPSGTPLQGAHLEDIIGGGVIIPYNYSPTTLIRQSSLPYSAAQSQVWACNLSGGVAPSTLCNVPDQYRTALTVQGYMWDYMNGVPQGQYYTGNSGGYDAMFLQYCPPTMSCSPGVTFFVDQISGRRLTVTTDYQTLMNQYSSTNTLLLDNYAVGSSYTDPAIDEGPYNGTEIYASSRGAMTYMTLTARHPYAAAPDGSANATGGYMNTSVTKQVGLIMPLTIVHAWGDTGSDLLAKWSTERATDKSMPIVKAPNCNGSGGQDGLCTLNHPGSQGDFDRDKITASWLGQFSRAAHLQAQIAGSVVQIHHVLGFNYSDATMTPAYPLGYDEGPSFASAESFTRLDVDSAYSVSSKTANQTSRNAAVLSIAAMASTLEGSAAAQSDGLPDTASTATRFEWGNAPPGTAGNWDAPSTSSPNAYEDPTHGVRSFVQFNSTNATQAANVVLVENRPNSFYLASGYANGIDDYALQPTLSSDEAASWESAYEGEIAAYASAGFTIATSQEAFLGPGQRGGYLEPGTTLSQGGQPTYYSHMPTKQRGPALIATLYDTNGNPTAIAHDIVALGINLGAAYFATKGGGGGAEANVGSTYDPSEASDVLKSQFVDKSNELGVNLSNGTVGYTAPAKIDVGSGGFPYELTADFEWNSSYTTARGAHTPPTVPQQGWTTNWNTALSMSGSGQEALGKSDIRATVNTIAAMMAVQDIYSSSQSISRDVSASLVLAWWARQIQDNVVTVQQGTKSQEFLQTTPGNWIAPGGGYATLTQTGYRVPYEYLCAPSGDKGAPYALSRGWNNAGMVFAVTSAHGDVQHYAYWQDYYGLDDFDECGLAQGFRLSTWTFPQGPTIALNYTDNSWDPGNPGSGGGFDILSSVSNNLGREIVFNYTGSEIVGFSNGLTGANARTVTLTPGTTTSTIADPTGAVTSFSFAAATTAPGLPSGITARTNNNAFLTQIFTADNQSVPNLQYDYDFEGHVYDVQDAVRLQVGGRNPYMFYIADGTRGERDDPLGNAWAVTYDVYGHPFRYVDELGNETDALADGRGRVLQNIFPEFDCEVFSYDDRNNTTSYAKVDKSSSCNTAAGSTHVISISATWDPTWNKPLSVTDGNGNTTNFAYYASGQNGASEIETATRPAVSGGNPTYNFSYDSNGKLLTATDPVTSSTSITTTNSYDSSEDLLSTIVDSGSGHKNLTTSFAYDAVGNVVTTTDPRGYVTTAMYDADRRKLESDHHDGNAGANLNASARTVYDVVGRDIEDDIATAFSGTTVSTWMPVKTTAYTPTSKVASVTDGDSRTTMTTYDNDDRLNVTTDPAGRQTQLTYDAAGHTLIETRAVGTSLQENYATYTYAQDGEKLSVYDADGSTHITTYAYDGFNRFLTTTFPDSSTETITSYDANSNVLSHKNRAGCQLSAQYDALNRQTSKTIPSGGNCGSAPADTITYTYDLGGRKTGYSDTLLNAIALTDDSAGRLISVATTMPGLSGTLTTSYGLDANGNRTTLTWPGSTTPYDATYTYDSLNRVVNVADSVATGYLATYAYDDFSRRTNVTYFNGASMSYAYTTAGDLTSLSNTLNGSANNLSYTLGYTNAHELNSETFSNLAYEFQPTIGTDTFAAVNTLNQYPSITLAGQGAQSLGYDGNGNLTSGGGWTYSYDPENKLMTACNASPCGSASVAASYAYDPLGRRTEKSGTGVAQTFFLNDGSDEVAEYSSSGTVLRRFVPGTAINEPIVYENCTSATAPNCTGSGPVYEYFQTDHHGSVVAMSGTSAAPVEGPYTYDGYGNGAPLTGVPFKFVGMYLDAETGLYYDRARYYSPLQGRFLQTDPIGYKDDLDMYAYVGNDPQDGIDPTGSIIQVWGDDGFVRQVNTDLRTISSKPHGAALVQGLRSSAHTIIIEPLPVKGAGNQTENGPGANDPRHGADSFVMFDPNNVHGGVDENGSNVRPAYVGLGHELGHAEAAAHGQQAPRDPDAPQIPDSTPYWEDNAVMRENQLRQEHGLPGRPSYYPDKPGTSQHGSPQDNDESSQQQNPAKANPCARSNGGCGPGGGYEIWN
jgi:RHS repeat-associated protein